VATRRSVTDRIERLLSIDGDRTPDSFHRELGALMWEYCGMERTDEGLRKAIDRIRELRAEFWSGVKVPGENEELNQALEKAGRIADFFELAELMCVDALHRTESCGGHFRAESQTPDGEALRDDENFAYVAAWEYTGESPVLHKENLEYENVKMVQRSYK
jgi:succinate dehydrogenase / fumarate reductase flavoprotein subunit